MRDALMGPMEMAMSFFLLVLCECTLVCRRLLSTLVSDRIFCSKVHGRGQSRELYAIVFFALLPATVYSYVLFRTAAGCNM